MFADAIKRLIGAELEIDRFHDDVTARLLPDDYPALARVSTREDGVFSGEAVLHGFAALNLPGLSFECLTREGARIEPGTSLAQVKGSARDLLSVERTLLNFLSHACGVASLTRRYVEAAASHGVRILATRKTLPGLRELQLAAVVAGGGLIHRRSLSDGILIKDNHLSVAPSLELLKRARQIRSPLHRVEIEVQNLEQLKQVLQSEARPELIMLDNLSTEDTKEAVRLIEERCEIEASGGITLDRVREVAATGIQYISIGRITHSASALDLTLDLEAQK